MSYFFEIGDVVGGPDAAEDAIMGEDGKQRAAALCLLKAMTKNGRWAALDLQPGEPGAWPKTGSRQARGAWAGLISVDRDSEWIGNSNLIGEHGPIEFRQHQLGTLLGPRHFVRRQLRQRAVWLVQPLLGILSEHGSGFPLYGFVGRTFGHDRHPQSLRITVMSLPVPGVEWRPPPEYCCGRPRPSFPCGPRQPDTSEPISFGLNRFGKRDQAIEFLVPEREAPRREHAPDWEGAHGGERRSGDMASL